MNKLYVIRCFLPRPYSDNDYLAATITAWSFKEILQKRRALVRDGWRVKLIKDDDVQMVFEAF